jgi:hypothetical protein
MFKHAHPYKIVQCDTPKGITIVGAIIIKWANIDKGFNHKWALFEHFDIFLEIKI